MKSTPIISRALIWIVALMTIMPFLMALMTSFKTQMELFQGVFHLPASLNVKTTSPPGSRDTLTFTL